ncbi:XRE family transcriptional regulator [Mangrovihabitans endophyticus]|uniref:Transcriptional regulator n=1 Tax=Mangrovihabitans endophyticus TaxID=1751298 RepID=A0A8J3BW08_9ACTN|nr:XRE family transcriptional regulator [Mangrovihabitans endophyticus]GGK72510.1 transcriptional regulator [Mangrovihabitans endophyticus]
MNHPLARALSGAGISTVDVASRLGVDPKTVQRWISGRVPYPRHRTALARLTGWSAHDLWPALPRPAAPSAVADEVRVVYPHRSAVPPDAYRRILAEAKREIDILAYSALFLAEDAAVPTLLRSKAHSGVRVRIALGDPAGKHIAERGMEEGIGEGMSARIRTALVSFGPLAAEDGVELRLHDTVLYNSICRGDDEMLVNTHVYGRPAAHAPVLHLREFQREGMTGTHRLAIGRVWANAQSIN